MPCISVIVPVYNVEPYLRRCVDSILGQTFSDFELILVDDGSPDHCPEICDEYARQDARIHVIHQKNGGLSAARNAGIDWAFANSESKWITFIDSDDWVHPDFLKLLQQAVNETGLLLSVCSNLATDGPLPGKPDIIPASVQKMTDMYRLNSGAPNLISVCAKLYCREQWKDIRFPVGKLHEDRFTTHKLLFQNEKAAVLNIPLYYYFVNENSIMHRKWTPERLDDLEAISQQLQYFKERDLPEAWKKTAVGHLTVLKSMLNQLNEIKPQYAKFRYFLHWELIKNTIKYRCRFRLPVKENIWLYETLYPRLMQLYWLIRAALRKLGIPDQ